MLGVLGLCAGFLVPLKRVLVSNLGTGGIGQSPSWKAHNNAPSSPCISNSGKMPPIYGLATLSSPIQMGLGMTGRASQKVVAMSPSRSWCVLMFCWSPVMTFLQFWQFAAESFFKSVSVLVGLCCDDGATFAPRIKPRASEA